QLSHLPYTKLFRSCSSSCAKLAAAKLSARRQTRNGRKWGNGESANRRYSFARAARFGARRLDAAFNACRRLPVSPIRRFISSPFRREFLNPAKIGIGFGCFSDAALALLAFA